MPSSASTLRRINIVLIFLGDHLHPRLWAVDLAEIDSDCPLLIGIGERDYLCWKPICGVTPSLASVPIGER